MQFFLARISATLGLLVSLEIVEHDDVALLQGWQETVLKPGLERRGVHGVVIGLARDGASQAQAKTKVIAL